MSNQQTLESTVRVLLSTLEPAALARIKAEHFVSRPTENRILRRPEAARILGRSPRAVDYLVSSGALRKIVFPGHTRGSGFRLSDVQALIGG
jgi:hypothetical protein